MNLIFANAGFSIAGPLLEASPEALDWILRVDVFGAWNTTSVFGRRMREAGRQGHICLTGSEHSLGMQHAGIGLYTATKMAVLGMGDVLRAELPTAIGVSVLCPELVDTELYLSKRAGPLPQDSDRALAFAGAVVLSAATFSSSLIRHRWRPRPVGVKRSPKHSQSRPLQPPTRNAMQSTP